MGQDKGTLAKVGRLCEALAELQSRQREIVDELARLATGAPGIGDQLKELESTFSNRWESRYRAPYLFNYTKDRPQWKRLIKILDGNLEAIRERIWIYIENTEPYFVASRHSFGLFVATFNQHAPAAERPVLQALNCKHSPMCGSDAEHTQRRMQEIRE
jgi:hypothetical protein